jgi:integrase
LIVCLGPGQVSYASTGRAYPPTDARLHPASKPIVDRFEVNADDLAQLRGSLTEAEMGKLLAALKDNRHGHRDWLIGLVIYRHGLRVSEAGDLRWDDIDLRKRTKSQG